MKKLITVTLMIALSAARTIATNETFMQKVEAELLHKGNIIWPSHPWGGVALALLGIYLIMAISGATLENLWDGINDFVADLADKILGRNK